MTVTANQVYVLLGIVVATLAICGSLLKAAAALVRIATTGARLSTAVGENTQATERLSGQFDAYQRVTDQRLEILEEAHKRRRFLA